jgi:hypothetical protein
MNLSLNEETVLALATPLLIATVQVAAAAHRRLSRLLRVRCIARISRMIMAREEPTDREMRSLRWSFPLGTISESAKFIAEHIYGRARYRLTLIAEVCEVEHSSLHNSQLYDISRFIEAYPDHSVTYISRLNMSLSWYEAALITQLMCRTGAPVAYTPLLTSQNRNLQLIGIYLCVLFTSVDAEPYLQQLAESEDEDLAYMALLSLCSIRGDITSPQVGSCLLRCGSHLRLAFIRHSVQACYSLQSCAKHLSDEEQMLFMQQLSSYKCQIVCN